LGAKAVVGWAMLYFALMPEGFAFSSELNPAHHNPVFDSLYVSLVTIGTPRSALSGSGTSCRLCRGFG